MYEMKDFQKDLNAFHITLSDQQLLQFQQYYDLLAEWNSFMNLTAITDFQDVLKKHFLDSLSIGKVVKDLAVRPGKLIDIGTGAGFPGIPIKIVFPKWKVTLLDSLQKRIRFLNEVTERLSLENVELLHGRAEDYARLPQMRGQYDLCVSRAVANLSTLSEFCLPFLKQGGLFVSYKSEKASEEIHRAERAIRILGGKILAQEEFYLPDSDIFRCLIVIQKISPTPSQYPRKAGTPLKQPL